eukprot:CAMPEP_0197863572 /NCGR_PEP_ID=MMETSP1438-20131217/41102_1 /TAXON_ID=1461541 /ORGANISM="Pterosperma sp., Strain CCMP1384" /LENGTH=105 /DNA_ID=CAMNT_0043481519 /DNA_START=307 /DNA_END=625 /DNA_ORIENTATION=-
MTCQLEGAGTGSFLCDALKLVVITEDTFTPRAELMWEHARADEDVWEHAEAANGSAAVAEFPQDVISPLCLKRRDDCKRHKPYEYRSQVQREAHQFVIIRRHPEV